jgi:hypothetical protein
MVCLEIVPVIMGLIVERVTETAGVSWRIKGGVPASICPVCPSPPPAGVQVKLLLPAFHWWYIPPQSSAYLRPWGNVISTLAPGMAEPPVGV